MTGNERQPRVRAADVAAAAGVSTTAVSFVLNSRDEGNISPATRERILRAAQELGYRPNHVARSLRRNSTSSIGLVTDAFASSPFGGRLLAAATEAANSAGNALLMMDLGGRVERAAEAIEALESRQVDAIIYATMGFTELDEPPVSRIPLVLANCVTRRPGRPSVSPDDAGGARAALEHLAGLGHTRVAMLGGHFSPGARGDEVGNVSGPIRWRAFKQAADVKGMDARLIGRGWAIDDGYAAAMEALSLPGARRPTALFAVCDRVAAGALLAAARLGIPVPEDLSIIGFDDQEALAESLVPALTTVALPHALMGSTAVAMAMAAARNDSPDPAHRVLECPVVLRGSTAPPRSGRVAVEPDRAR
ncbi:LacI family DNA-binding transcriptional regulator [Actinomyces timonensis]|uniref:LacI family DNA-binding transcriptional regulator n=1 Tax=Actinomyces timonensis TaxID=1288391 RepID=UPI0005B9836D|nr:LacI family DNA-binding transcriptional regulator [Actinomyces timonensis]